MEPARENTEMRDSEQVLWRLGVGWGGVGWGGEVWKRSDEFQNTLGYINVYVAPSGKHTVKRYSL